MRIGYLTYGLDRSPTGIGRYAVELLTALAALPEADTRCNGLHPEIVLLTTEQEDPAGLWQSFEHHPLPGCRLLPVLTTAGHLAVAAAIRRYRLDIIHDPNGIAPFLGPAAGARRVVTIHDAFPYVYPAKHNHLDNWRYRWILPYAARRADAVITVSECSRRDLAQALQVAEARIRVTSEGVDPQFAPVPDGPARRALLERYGVTWPYVLYVGGINPRKNISRLFEAYAQVLAAYGAGGHAAPRLVIAGKRQWRTEEIEATFRRLDLGEHVHFTGYVNDADLPGLYSGAELLAFPSLYEGFGLPPLEAMACGTPVVTSDVSSLPEVVGDAALTVNPFDVEALAAALMRVLTDSTLRKDLRERGLRHAARFTWSRTARETLHIYRSLHAADPCYSERSGSGALAMDTTE